MTRQKIDPELWNQTRVIVRIFLTDRLFIHRDTEKVEAANGVNPAENQSNGFFIIRHHWTKSTVFSPAARFSGQFKVVLFFPSNETRNVFEAFLIACLCFWWPWTFSCCSSSVRHSFVSSFPETQHSTAAATIVKLIFVPSTKNWPNRMKKPLSL